MNLADILLMKNGETVKPDADLFDILLSKKLSGGSGVITTITGNPLAFTTRKAQTAIDTKLIMFPIQEGSGDPSPTNVRPITGRQSVSLDGCGKNLFRVSDIKEQVISGQGGTRYGMRYIAGKDMSYTLSIFDVNDYVYARVIHEGTYSNSYILSTPNSNNSPITISVYTGDTLIVYDATQNHSENQARNALKNLQVEVGSQQTTYEPYQSSNKITISFPALGKNLVDSSDGITGGDYFGPNGEITHYPSIIVYKNQFFKAGTYTLSWVKPVSSSAYIRMNKLDLDGTFIETMLTSNSNVPFTFVLETDCLLQIPADMSVTNIQIELGSSPTTYEPYTNTVYGGTLDLTSGVLTVDRGYVDMGDISWQKASGASSPSGYIFRSVSTYTISRSTEILSSIYKTGNWQYTSQVENNGICANSSGQILVRNDTYDNDVEAFTTAMSGVQLVYELAQPTTIQLTPEEVQLLKGNNTIWTDGDEIELTYKA